MTGTTTPTISGCMLLPTNLNLKLPRSFTSGILGLHKIVIVVAVIEIVIVIVKVLVIVIIVTVM